MTLSRVVAGVLAALAMLAAGAWLGGHPEYLPQPVRDALVGDDVALNAEATNDIEDSYYKDPSPALLQNSSISGMVAALKKRYHDRFSHYFSPEEFKKFQDLTSGRFSGVGMAVSEVKQGLRVADVFANSPAKAAGIKRGDTIVAVNGRSIAGKDAQLSTARIKGPPGSTVRLTVVGVASGKRRQVTLKRAEVEVPVARGKIEKAGGKPVAYVRLSTFSATSHGALRQKIEQLYKRGAQGLILDLRGNGGGLLTEAVLNASTFVKGGDVVVKTSGRRQPTHVYRAVGDPLDPKPMVVLIDHDTASASEILTSALADYRLATTVGTRSFGKGVFQQVLTLQNGGALSLTVGEYFTSKGVSLGGKGIDPQVKAPDNPKTKPDEGLQKALAVLGAKLSG